MKRPEISYSHEEQDGQRYEREREWWLEAVTDVSQSKPAEIERQKDLPITGERQTEDGQ